MSGLLDRNLLIKQRFYAGHCSLYLGWKTSPSLYIAITLKPVLDFEFTYEALKYLTVLAYNH